MIDFESKAIVAKASFLFDELLTIMEVIEDLNTIINSDDPIRIRNISAEIEVPASEVAGNLADYMSFKKKERAAKEAELRTFIYGSDDGSI